MTAVAVVTNLAACALNLRTLRRLRRLNEVARGMYAEAADHLNRARLIHLTAKKSQRVPLVTNN
jgi:hypothetical protein